jgi:hypothetical protein
MVNIRITALRLYKTANRKDGYIMICAKFDKTEEGYKVDAEWGGCGNANIVEAFRLHDINIVKELDKMEIGQTRIYNIGWYSGNCFGISKRGIEPKIIQFGIANK